jgi:hypothetical protein
VKTTYNELATMAQMPTEPCNVHGEARASLAPDLPPSEFPRAALAIDTNSVAPVTPKGPNLLGERDPYNALHAMLKPKPSATPTPETETAATSEPAKTPDANETVLKAIPVAPGETLTPAPADTPAESPSPSETPEEIRRAIPVYSPTPEPTEPEVRRAEPVDPGDENN